MEAHKLPQVCGLVEKKAKSVSLFLHRALFLEELKMCAWMMMGFRRSAIA